MQKDFDENHPNSEIFILGINEAGFDDSKAIYEGRDLPWLLDTKEADWWGNWGVALWDLVILDRDGNVAGVFDLFEHDLGDPDEYEALKAFLLDSAESLDMLGS